MREKTGRDGLTNPGWHLPGTLRQWDSGQNGRAVAALVLSQSTTRNQLLAVPAVQNREEQTGADAHRLS